MRAAWVLCGVAALSLGCGEVIEPTAEPTEAETVTTGRLVYSLDDCGVDYLDEVPMLENLRGYDDCSCSVGEGALGTAACLLEGGPQLEATGRAWWCSEVAGRCRRLEGNVACLVGEAKSLWSQGFDDTRTCGCVGVGFGAGGVLGCDVVRSGEFSVGVVVTTCCVK